MLYVCQPFYGGKLHRVSAEVKNGNTGNITCKVQGEWNSSFEFTYANVSTSWSLAEIIFFDLCKNVHILAINPSAFKH